MSFLASIKRFFSFSSKKVSLAPGDRMLSCEDCNTSFVFDAGEQRFFKEKGFTDPKRCPRCRKKVRFRMRRRGRGHSHSNGVQNGRPSHNHFHQQQQRSRPHAHRHSVIDGESPYADER